MHAFADRMDAYVEQLNDEWINKYIQSGESRVYMNQWNSYYSANGLGDADGNYRNSVHYRL